MSRDFFKTSGKRIPLPAAATGGEWSFEGRPGGWIIATRLVDGKLVRRRLFMHESKGSLSAALDGRLYFGTVESEGGAAGTSHKSDQDLVAQFPGKVRKVLVKDGAVVTEGTPLLLLEAMKMEFSVKAPFSGTVEKIRVSEGQSISPGDRFLDFRANEKGEG